MNVRELKEHLNNFDDELEICCAEEYGIIINLDEDCFSVREYFNFGEKTKHLVIAG